MNEPEVREMEIEKLLYSLIPLILIIIFSWFFSFLGKKIGQREPDGEEVQTTEYRGDEQRGPVDLFELLTDDEEEEEVPRREQTEIYQPPGDMSWDYEGTYSPYEHRGAPTVSPEPIRPKFWG